MSTTKHTIKIQFGHLVKLNELTIYLALTFQQASTSALVKQHAPEMIPTLKLAREAIAGPMIPLLMELISLGVPAPTAQPAPPDYWELHLSLDESLLQQIGELVTNCAKSWQDLGKLLPQPQPRKVQEQLQQLRKDSAEVAGYWLAALAEAGVPDIAAAR